MGLMEDAKKAPRRPGFNRKWAASDEHVQLAIAVLTGDITYSQAAAALDIEQTKSPSAVRYWCATVLRDAHAKGMLDLKTLLKAPQAPESEEKTEEKKDTFKPSKYLMPTSVFRLSWGLTSPRCSSA